MKVGVLYPQDKTKDAHMTLLVDYVCGSREKCGNVPIKSSSIMLAGCNFFYVQWRNI